MEGDREAVKEELSISFEAFSEKHLGLPTAVGRLNSGVFDRIVERAKGKIQG